jgi:hypothetical protein
MKEKLNQTMQKLSENIIRYKVAIVVIVILLTIFFGYELTKIQLDTNIINSLPDTDPVAKLYKEVGDKYESNSSAMVLLQTKNVFDTTVLNDIRLITDSIQTIPGVTSVTSLTNVIDIKSSDWGIEVGKLIDEYNMPKTQGQLDTLRNRVFAKDMYHGTLVSDDSSATIIAFTMLQNANEDSITDAVKKIITKIKPHEKVYYTGIPFMMKDVKDIIISDLKTLLPITSFIIIVILFFGFRSFRGVVLPLLNVLIAIIWTIGLMALLRYKMTIVSDTIPVILLALGSAYTIHVLNRINEEQGSDRLKVLVKSLAYIIVPVFLAYITTAFGFLSFVFGSYLTMIRDFGIFTAIGITFAFLLSVTFSPAFIALISMYKKDQTTRPEDKALVSKFLKPLADKVMTHPKRIVAMWTLAALIFAVGIFFIQRKVDMVSYFKKDSQTYKSQNLVDRKLGGTSPIFIVFDGDVQNPEFLKKMKETEDFMKKNSNYVSYTMSVADLVAQMNDAMGEGDKIPAQRDKIEQLWMMIEGEDIMPQLVNDSLNEAVIQARFSSLDSKKMHNFVVMMQNFIDKEQTKQIRIREVGMPKIYGQIDKSLLRSQISSLIAAIILMLIVVSLTMWSIKDGILSLLPLILTIVISYGFMGFAHIPLDIATVLVASVTLGVGIDYAVHIISHFNNYYDETKDVKLAIEKAISVSGNAIFINVLAVALGFLVFVFSQLVPLNNFGILMALSMFVSGFAAITILPALIMMIRKNKTN